MDSSEQDQELKTDCDTATTFDSMSDFPLEFDGEHHITKESEDKPLEECIPDISHLREILSPQQYDRMHSILLENNAIFARSKNDLGCTHLIRHDRMRYLVGRVSDAFHPRSSGKRMSNWML